MEGFAGEGKEHGEGGEERGARDGPLLFAPCRLTTLPPLPPPPRGHRCRPDWRPAVRGTFHQPHHRPINLILVLVALVLAEPLLGR